ncbi:hypothetical protein F4814DRAFT_458106 [Daldinia grandis]|nr:hypothetical protein F4814DRAFT_458106 [Daldinia grandis]
MAEAPFSSSVASAQREEFLDGPAEKPPDGIQSNLTNPHNSNNGGFLFTSFCLAIATVFVLVRLYAKVFLIGRIIFVGIAYCIYRLIINVGFRIHQWDIRVRSMSEHLYIMHLCINLYSAHLMVTKTAILLEWIHIFVPDGRRSLFYRACCCLIWANIIFYSVVIVVANLVCIPIQRIWDKTVDGECNGNENPLNILSASLNLVFDIFILVLPQPVIWKLHMPKTKKMGISIVFAIGILATMASCFRVANSVQYRSGDSTYVASKLVIWSLVEMTCSFLVFCVPIIPGIWSGSHTRDPTAMRMWCDRSIFRTHPLHRFPGTRINEALSRCWGRWNIDKVFSFSRDSRYEGNADTEWPLDQLQGIICTREIIRTVEDASSFIETDGRSESCPWTEPV